MYLYLTYCVLSLICMIHFASRRIPTKIWLSVQRNYDNVALIKALNIYLLVFTERFFHQFNYI